MFARPQLLAISLRQHCTPNRTRGTYKGQVRVEGIFILGSDNFVEVVGGRESRRNLIVLVENGNVLEAGVEQMQDGRKAKSTAPDDQERVGF